MKTRVAKVASTDPAGPHAVAELPSICDLVTRTLPEDETDVSNLTVVGGGTAVELPRLFFGSYAALAPAAATEAL